MDFLRPQTWPEALARKAERPAAVPIAGGTDVMVEVNFDRRRPEALLDLTRIPELTGWERDERAIRIGANVTYTRVIEELGAELPGLAMASRTVGSPQIRNRGTIAGNLGAASPAGDAHPILLALGASVEAESVRGTRLIPAVEFYVGVKRHSLAPDELIRAVHVPLSPGPQQFSKIGTRNAMVIAVCSFALALDVPARRVGTGIGSAAPTPRRAVAAEDYVSGALPWESRDPIPDGVGARFGELVAQTASPIDDVRGSAAYRRHALAVLARRNLAWAWKEYQCA
ncbi:carbon-monoxide dehydrogenase medium subunit [Rhizocola hellebori]|uniref:Carbon-monoxide dehydrogenase medium subunit n=1 Tax=Rhizocola hellebori TaxID=1392758 RepID=A0A8J3Q936_9ACTN|nr:FAD binding domain-containing protein [Rhizocola hellebori]GIH05436.1 carbon-monoxide dehydrogenase medium subunit [Rhizocola hellebori]